MPIEDIFVLDDFDLKNRTVLVKFDLSMPLDPVTGEILDDSKLKSTLDTLYQLSESKVVIIGKQSTPGTADFTSLEKHAHRLSYLLRKKVSYVDDLFGSTARNKIKQLNNGDILLLENTNFYSEELVLADSDYKTYATTQFVSKLAPLADFYVCDAFSEAHKSSASLVGFAEMMPSIAGRRMEKELNVHMKVLAGNTKPAVALLGGMKINQSLELIEHLLSAGVVDKVLTAGLIASFFLAAKGYELGTKTTELIESKAQNYDELSVVARKLTDMFPEKIVLPSDVCLNNRGKRMNFPVEKLPAEMQICDLGLDTIVHYTNVLKNAKLIILSGPAGVFETDEFALGTVETFNAAAESDGFSIFTGGYTRSVVERLDLLSKIDHVSTGSDASISFLAGKRLPAVEALKHSKKLFEGGPYQKRR